MKRLLLFTLLSLFAVYSNAHTEEPDPLSFFPHHVGDTWVYKYYHGGVSRLFITKSWVDNDSIFLAYNGSNDPFYIIYNNDVFNPSNRGYWLEYRLDAEKHDRWVVLPAGPEQGDLRMDAIVDNVYRTHLFGRETTVKKISYYVIWPGSNSIEEGSTYGFTQWLASGFGVVQEILEGSSEMEFILTGCVINGDTLGVVTDIPEPELPFSFFLQAYPNPCSNSTTIRCSVPTGITDMTLSVCDYTGAEILHQRIMDFPITLNTTTLACGTYWCKIIAGRHTVTVPLVVLR